MKLRNRLWLFLLAPLVFLPASGHAASFTSLYVLGDSLSDVGNLFIATGTPPLNAIFPEPLPQDPPYFQGRFSDGPVYAEHLWRSLGLAGSLTPSYDGGTGYAVGGARSRYHVFDNPGSGFNPLTDDSLFPQFSLLGQRDALLSDTAGALDPGALYTVWVGSNDVADAFRLGGDAGALLDRAAGDIVDVVADLIAAGAEHLLVPNVPNLGLVPEVLPFGPDAQALASWLAQQLNDLVDQGLASLAANIIRLDTFSFLTTLVNDPAEFGLPSLNVTGACFTGYVGESGTVCSNPENYAFWDRLHPSAVTHRELGRLASVAVPEPATIVLMALGLFGMGYCRRTNASG